MSEVRITVRGDREVVEMLRASGERARDLFEPLNAWVDDVVEQTRTAFETGGANLPEPWAPTKPRYVAWKLRHGGEGMLLVNTGRLRDSVTRRPMDIERVGRLSVEIGTSVPYAGYIQDGTSKMPARPFLVVTPELDHRLDELLADHVAEQM